MRWLPLLSALFLAACGSSPPKTPMTESEAPADTGPKFEIEPVAFVPLPEFTATKKAELGADGVIFADGKEVGHIKGGEVYLEGTGEWGTLQEDGSLVGAGLPEDEGAIFVANMFVRKKAGTSIEIADDGTVYKRFETGGERKKIGMLEPPTKASRAGLVLVSLGILVPPEKPETPAIEQEPPKKKPGKKPGKRPGKRPGKKKKAADG